MYTLLRYGVGGLLYSYLLIVLFESINPPSWPKSAVWFELAGCWVFVVAILAMSEVREKRLQAQREKDKHLAELRSKMLLELEKHRMTLEAQHRSDEVSNTPNTGTSPMVFPEQVK